MAVICENFAEENLVDYFGSQSSDKLFKALSIHNELSVAEAIRELREMNSEGRQEWIRERSSVKEAMKEVQF